MICKNRGYYPRCIFCQRKGSKPKKPLIEELRDKAAEEREEMIQQASDDMDTFNMDSTGIESVDNAVHNLRGGHHNSPDNSEH